jgi:hypothetical protein
VSAGEPPGVNLSCWQAYPWISAAAVSYVLDTFWISAATVSYVLDTFWISAATVSYILDTFWISAAAVSHILDMRDFHEDPSPTEWISAAAISHRMDFQQSRNLFRCELSSQQSWFSV